MAVVLGTNSGFVTTAPVDDPAGGDTTIDGSSVVTKHTSPAYNAIITQIGWYRGAGTNGANFEVALYAEAAGIAASRLYVDASNSSTSSGWITVPTEDWFISASTAYWLGLQMDGHSGSSTVDNATSGGAGSDVRTSQSTLADPYGGGTVADGDGMYAVYALIKAASGVQCANLTQGNDGDDDNTSVTASVTFTANRLYLLTICARADAVQPDISSISVPADSGMAWTLIGADNDFDNSGSRRTLFLYRAMPTSTQSGAITITFTDTQTAKSWSIDEITGMDTSGTQGSGAIVQQVPNAGASVTSLTVTLGAFSSTTNATYGAFGNAGEGSLVAGAGFTRYSDQQVTGECGVATIFKRTTDTSVDVSNGTMDIGGIAVEIKEASVSSAIKTVLGLARASVKTVNGLAIASVKTIDGLA